MIELSFTSTLDNPEDADNWFAHSDLAADILAISFDETDDGLPDTTLRARILCLNETIGQAVLIHLMAQALITDPGDCQWQHVPDLDWVAQSQAQFTGITILGQLAIVPDWQTPPSDARWLIKLNPGNAFGTGSHPTTALCLSWLVKNLSDAELAPTYRLLDYGCGSGILALSAAKLGVSHLDAVDVAPEAVECTRNNAIKNNCTLNSYLPDALPGNRTYDLIVANILLNPLCALAEPLARLAKPGGQFILSGILRRQLATLQEAYRPYARTCTVADCADDWLLVTGQWR